MTAHALFWLTIGPALAAVVVALLADAFGGADGSIPAASASLLLLAGGTVGVVGGWAFDRDLVAGVFRVGGAPSTVSGLVLVLAGMSLAASVGSRHVMRGHGAGLVGLVAVGSALSAASTDLLVTVLALETVAVSAYALVAIGGGRDAKESAFKYFIQGAVASGLLVLGTVVIAGAASGDVSYGAALAVADSSGFALPMLAATLIVFAGLAFKAGAAPMHSWAPDAYEHAPEVGAAVLAGPVKLAAVTATGAFFLGVLGGSGDFFSGPSIGGSVAVVLAALAGVSVIVGSATALAQSSFRRMLAYAGVAQAGYGLAAIAALNVSAAVFHLSLYAIASTGVFVAAAMFRGLRPAWDGSIAGLAGMGRRYPVRAAAVTVALASLAGLPPLAGFWGKFQAFAAPVAAAVAASGAGAPASAWAYAALALAGIVASVVSLGYYGSVVKELFFGSGDETSSESEREAAPPPGRPDGPTVVVLVIAIALLACGVAPLVTGLSTFLRGFLLVG